MGNQNITKFPRYERYKDSGVIEIDQIPLSWKINRLGNILSSKTVKGGDDLPLLSITREKGVILRDLDNLDSNHNYIPDDLSNYKVIQMGEFGMNKMKAWQGSYGVSLHSGIVSPAYYIFEFRKYFDKSFFHYAIRSSFYIGLFYRASDGVRIGQWDLSQTRMKEIPFIYPSEIKEQTAIAQFIDHKTAQIDRAIAIKEEQIKLLNERKQIMIQEAVTKGLDPTVPMKDSGVEWIGEIPEHWEVRALKYVARINQNSLDEATNKNLEIEYVDIGSVSYAYGIEKTEKYLFANAPSRARRIAKKGDTIVSTVRTYLKSIDYIDSTKEKYIFSTGFAVISPKTSIHSEYLTSFVGSLSFTNQVDTASTGISYPAINSTRLSNLWVVVPSRTEQEEIVTSIKIESESFNRGILVYQNQIKVLKEYKTTLINEAVTGKIKVN